MRNNLPLVLFGLTVWFVGCGPHDELEHPIDEDSSALVGAITGSYRLKVLNVGECLTATTTVTAGGGLTHGPCSNGLVFSERVSGSSVQIVEKSTGLCLAVLGRATGDGVPIVFSSCNEGSEQRFAPTIVSNRTRTFKSVLSGRCVDLSLSKGTLHQWACHGGTNQRFDALVVTTASATSSLRFPRLAGMLIGNPKNYDEPAYQAQIAKLDYAVLGMYEGWERNGTTPLEATRAIRARNPNVRLANYTIMTEVSQTSTSPAAVAARAKLSSEDGPNGIGDWWARDEDGSHTDWNNGTYGTWDTNLTLLTKPDANGNRWTQWKARFDYDRVLAGHGFDDWYCDNNFYRPRVDADWNRDGVTDSRDDIKVRNWIRDGQRAYYDRARAVAPGMRLIVNADSDLASVTTNGVTDNFTQYKGAVDYAFLEHVIGKSWSRESWAGFASALDWYHRTIKNVRQPGGVVLDAYLPSTTDYKSARYSFGMALLDDGYFSLSTNYNTIVWIDEFDLAGQGTTKWLGAAIDGPQTAPFSSGVYRRRFERGIVLVNPKGNGTRSVTIEAGYQRFVGKQAPAVNNGSTSSTITLADRDAILLVKR